MVSEDYENNISAKLELLLKDIDCIADHARDMGCPTPLFSLASQIHFAAAAQGFSGADPASVCKVIGDLAGLERG